MTRALLAPALLLALAACVPAKGEYPSLARRPEEGRVSGTATPAPAVPEPPPATLSADLATRIGQLVDQASAAHRDFEARRPSAARAAAGAGALGSESWASASLAIAALEGQHDIALTALSSLDDIEVEHRVAVAGADDAITAAVVQARDQVAALTDAEAGVLADLQARAGG